MMNKRVLSFVLCVIMVASLFTGMVSSASADYDTVTYSVKNGDYLFKICKGYGLDYYACKNAIMILNGFVSEAQLNRLTVGQTITLPASNAIAATVKGSTSTTTTTTQTVTINGVTTTTSSTSTLSGVSANYAVAYYLIPHVMQYGETLASVCNDLGTSYGAYSSVILAANGITNANNVWAGKTVYIPSTKAPSAGACYAVVAHTVSSGETMTSICSQYGQSYNANATLINGLNRSTNLNKIYVGQTLYIPVVATAATGTGTGTGTGSGSAAAVQSGYKITFEVTSNGKPYATIDDHEVNRADLGKTVKIVANGNSGFAQSALKVIRTDNKASVAVASNNTFVMPPCDVVITVEYKKAQQISRTPAYHGSYTTQVNGVNVDFACPNDKVVLAFNPDYSYTCVSASYTVGGSSTSVNIKQSTDGTWSFVMPEESVVVEVVFDRGDYKALTATGFDSTKEGNVVFKVDGTQCKSAAQNAQVVATVTPKTDYIIKEVKIYETGSSPVRNVTFTKSGNNYVFKMPDAPVTVEVKFEYSKTWALKYSGNSNGTIYFTDTTGKIITSAREGDTVYTVTSPKAKYIYKAGSLLITSAGGKTNIPYSGANNEFKMPGDVVSATAVWDQDPSQIQYKTSVVKCPNGKSEVWVNPGGAYGAQKKNTALVYEDVEVKVTANSGYIFTNAKIYKTGDPMTIPASTIKYGTGGNVIGLEYKMPAYDVSVEFESEKVNQFVDINCASGIEGTLEAYYNNLSVTNALVNTTFEIKQTTNAGYEFQKIKVKSVNTGEETIVEPKNGRYYYTVKAEEYSTSAPNNILQVTGEWKSVEKVKLNIPLHVSVSGSTSPVDSLDSAHGVFETIGKNVVTLNPSLSSLNFDVSTVDVFTGSETEGNKKTVTPSSATATAIVFEMPNDATTVIVKFQPISISVTSIPGGTTAALTSASVVPLSLGEEFTVEWDWGDATTLTVAYGATTETIVPASGETSRTFTFNEPAYNTVTLTFS